MESNLFDLLTLADNGNPEACYKVYMAFKSSSGSAEKQEAASYLKKAADILEALDADPDLRLRVFCEMGAYYCSIGEKQAGVEYYGRAAELGDRYASIKMAEHCLSSNPPEKKSATLYLEHAEFNNDPDQEFYRAELYLKCDEYIKANMIFRKLLKDPEISPTTALLCQYRCANEGEKASLISGIWAEEKTPQSVAVLFDYYKNAGEDTLASLSEEQINLLVEQESKNDMCGPCTIEAARRGNAEAKSKINHILSAENWKRFLDELGKINPYRKSEWEQRLKNYTSIWDVWADTERTPTFEEFVNSKRINKPLDILDAYYPDNPEETPECDFPAVERAFELGRYKATRSFNAKTSNMNTDDRWLRWAADQGSAEAIEYLKKPSEVNQYTKFQQEDSDVSDSPHRNTRKTLRISSAAVLAVIIIAVTISRNGTGFGKKNYEYEKSNNTAIITEYTGKDGNLTIPSKIGGKTTIALNISDNLEALTISSGIEALYFYSPITIQSLILDDGMTDITLIFCDEVSIGEIIFPDSMENVSLINNSSTTLSEKGIITIPCNAEIETGEAGTWGNLNTISVEGNAVFSLSGNTRGNTRDAAVFPDLRVLTVYGDIDVDTGAFYNCSNLQSVTISGNADMASSAFANCTGITTMNISGNADISSLQYCSSLETITIGGNLVLGYKACSGCSSLVSIYVEGNAEFAESVCSEGCEALQSVIVNGNISTGSYTFYGCSQLETLEISGDADIGAWAFQNCVSLNELKIKGDVYINKEAFVGCLNLSTLLFSGNVKFGSEAFKECTAVTSLVINGDASVGAYCFSGCSALKTVNIQGNTSTGSNPFDGCLSLEYVELNKVVTLGYGAFEGCSSLQTIILGEGDESGEIGRYAFSGTSITELRVPGNILRMGWGMFYKTPTLQDVYWDENSDGEEQFIDLPEMFSYDCEKPVKLHLSDSVTGCYVDTLLGWRGGKPVIYAPEESYAQQIAETYGLEFVTEGD